MILAAPDINALTLATAQAKNIAYKKPSSHSSTRTYDGTELVASFGNDGDRTAEWQRCSFTSYEEQPWWQVDLKEVAAVTHVRITNSIAWSSHDTYPYNVSVGKDSSNGGRNNALCVNNGMLASGEMKTFYCPKLMMGRYVSVFLNRKEFLPVCELEVYEEKMIVSSDQTEAEERLAADDLDEYGPEDENTLEMEEENHPTDIGEDNIIVIED
eukprot:gene5392-biopygen401